jgi:hypothetical protein
VETLEYLDGNRPFPEIDDVAGFDDMLDGVDLASDVELAPVVALLEHRLWRPEELLGELSRLFAAAGAQRLRFVGGPGRAVPEPVLAWCAEQSLRSAAPLPAELRRGERAAISAVLRPEWVSAETVRRLDDLGLDDAGVDRVLAWLLDGQVPPPAGSVEETSPVAAVMELRRPRAIATPDQLARVSRCLYSAHERLHRLAPDRWLALLQSVAAATLERLPPLTEALTAAREAQWVLIDCLGLPLLDALAPALVEGLGEWNAEPPRFAVVSETTTTDACYRDLLAAELSRPVEKIDVVDSLIHEERPQPFAELAAVARTRLATAIRRLVPRLDPARPLVVFADHGFRLAADGRRFTHGGASALERVVPLWHLAPRGR